MLHLNFDFSPEIHDAEYWDVYRHFIDITPLQGGQIMAFHHSLVPFHMQKKIVKTTLCILFD
jgi:hypothetical protein